ncbi:MAG: tRNA lysidine(34) synthetase TilS [Chloroflexi bacterium]|nr:tRNA lysidine(34) synthetase TilS [Chloroflexota bacterium]
MNDIVALVRRCLAAHQVSGALVVAVSGGPDSVCLLHALWQLRHEMGLQLNAAHLNHRLHAQAEPHARYVARLCQRLGVPAIVEAQDVATYRREYHLSLEEAARRVRYTFLAEVAGQVGAGWVLTGHTADDQVETVLMHLLRGTGWVGVQGMAQAGPYPYAAGQGIGLLRPLLRASKAETGSYCRAAGLRPRQDPTNVELSPTRNRVRHQLLPALEAYNPRFREALLRVSAAAREQVALLDGLVDAIWRDAVSEDAEGLRIASDHLLQQPQAVRQHLLRRAVERTAGSFTDFEAHHLERLVAALEAGAGKLIPLPHGLRATTRHHALYLARLPAAPLPALGGECPLAVPGETRLDGWVVTARLVPAPQAAATPQKWRTYIAYQSGTPLWVRARRPGDRFQPAGMAQAKKLQDFMVDAHIPREWRDRVPLVCSPEGILWVAGWRLSEAARVGPAAEQALEVEFRPTGS